MNTRDQILAQTTAATITPPLRAESIRSNSHFDTPPPPPPRPVHWSIDSWECANVAPVDNSRSLFSELSLDQLMDAPTIIKLLSDNSSPQTTLSALAVQYRESVQSRLTADLQLVGCPKIRLEASLRQLTVRALTEMPLESPATWLFLDGVFGALKNADHLPSDDLATLHKSLLDDTQTKILQTLGNSSASHLSQMDIQELTTNKEALVEYLHDCANTLRRVESPDLWPECKFKKAEVRKEFLIDDFFEKLFKLDSGTISFHDFDFAR